MSDDEPPLDPQTARLLASLDEPERNLLTLRFGFDRGEPRTLEELGALLGLTRDEARIAEEKAMDKLKRRDSG